MPPKRLILDDKLYVQISTIPNAGKGLFALKRIPSGTFIGRYIGDLSGACSCGPVCDRSYAMETLCYQDDKGKWIEPKLLCGKRLDNKMRWINDPRYAKARINARTQQTYLGEVEIYSTKAILPGEEILMCYGHEYWKAEEEAALRMWLDY